MGASCLPAWQPAASAAATFYLCFSCFQFFAAPPPFRFVAPLLPLCFLALSAPHVTTDTDVSA